MAKKIYLEGRILVSGGISNIKNQNPFDLLAYIQEVTGQTSPIVSASTTVEGIVRLATKAETVTGLSSTTAVTPNALLEAPIFNAKTTTISTTGTKKEIVLADATAGVLTITLTNPTANDDFVVTVKKIDASVNVVNVVSPAGTIEGAASPYVLANTWESVTLVSNGGNYYIIASV